MDGATLGEKKRFKAYRIKTEGLIQEIANSLADFEKNKDPLKLLDLKVY